MVTTASSDQSNIHQLVEHELDRVLRIIVTDKKEPIIKLPKVRKVYEWYKEDKDSKHEDIPTKIVNEIIKNLLESLVCHLSDFLIHNISVKFEKIQSNDMEIKEAELEFAVKPFVDFIKKVNKVDTLKARILFKLTLAGKLEGIRIRSAPKRRNIHVDRFSGPLRISIVSLEISIVEVPTSPIVLEEPIQLLGAEIFKIENMTLELEF
jgi:hypothetical protein